MVWVLIFWILFFLFHLDSNNNYDDIIRDVMVAYIGYI